jgi:hypothetical protein
MRKPKIPKPEANRILMLVHPKKKYLDDAIAKGGNCNPRLCWNYLEVASVLYEWDPGGNHHVRVDAGHIKFNLWGWRYQASTPLTVKRGILHFDKKEYDLIRIRPYTLHCIRTTKIRPLSEERKTQINAARRKRYEEGRGDKTYKKPKGQTMRDRVVGYSGIV